MTDLRIVYVTASNHKEAESIASKLIDNGFAACVNIYDNVTSIYKWDGQTKKEPESTLFIKTTKYRVEDIRKFIKKNHTYSCPCVISIPVIDADKDYMEWIEGIVNDNKDK